ncbi:MAG: FAD-dependent monooxygenase [Hyphomicrobiales bacterium]
MPPSPVLPDSVPVLVVGAGPTGLLCANLLGTYGAETLVVEQNETTSDLPKAVLLDDEGLRALQTTGLADKIAEHVISGHGARYYAPDGACFAEVDSPVTSNGYPRRNAFLQPDLEKIMAEGLGRFENMQLRFETKLISFTDEGDRVTVVLELPDSSRKTVACKFLLACDGGRSTVRGQLGFKMQGETDARDWVVIDTLNDPDRDKFSKFYCDAVRPTVSIPMPGGGRRYEYMVMPGEDGSEMASRKTIRSVLAKFRTIPDSDILRSVVYTFHARVAEHLTKGRVALLGDAAHLTPPFAGQGMNAGLRDAYNVCWKVKHILMGHASAGLLSSYEVERKAPIVEMIDYAVALGEIVMPEGGLDEAAKDEIRAHLMGKSAPTGAAAKIRPKPQANYTQGWLDAGGLGRDGNLTGYVFPQFEVADGSGRAQLLDEYLGVGFALATIGVGAAEVLSKIPSSPLSPKPIAVLVGEGNAPGTEIETVHSAGEFFGLDAREGEVFLIRPDRFIAAHWRGDAYHEISATLSALAALRPGQDSWPAL